MLLLQSCNISNFTYSKNKENTSLIKSTNCLTNIAKTKNQTRTMFRVTITHVTKPLQIAATANPIKPYAQSYATYRVHTPKTETSSNESLNNNPAIKLVRKHGTKVTQHPELVKDVCKEEACEKKLCFTPCNEQKESKAVGHLCHENEKVAAVFLSPTDIDKENRPQYLVPYKDPHDVTSDSKDLAKDALRSQEINDIIKKKIQDGGFDD